ncbi:Glycine N-methyltransferase [Lamellibrachia satsuma]|nr:Glycine N-methyltransferase [Lamellibrachia satsuma]
MSTHSEFGPDNSDNILLRDRPRTLVTSASEHSDLMGTGRFRPMTASFAQPFSGGGGTPPASGHHPCFQARAAGARQSATARYQRQRAPDSSKNEKMVDSVYQTRSLGVTAKGLRDQYADGAAARVWELYIGCTSVRTSQYKQWLTALLREHDCENILDVACGTGDVDGVPEGGFDAVVCLNNSFSNLHDFEGSTHYQKVALTNFRDMIKPGGILVIDHHNFDDILTNGHALAKNIYNVGDGKQDVKVSNLYVNCRPTLTTFDYTIDIPKCNNGTRKGLPKEGKYQFRLSCYPHRLAEFSNLLKGVFGEDCAHSIHGDSQTLGRVQKPAYYTHIAEKSAKHAST